MTVNVLLVNPPIYDFTAFDFWLRPYGLLRVAGRLRACELSMFDYLVSRERDAFGRGIYRDGNRIRSVRLGPGKSDCIRGGSNGAQPRSNRGNPRGSDSWSGSD